MTVAELIKKLEGVPGDWDVYATSAGGSLQVWEADGFRYGYVFTDDEREPRMLIDRRREAEQKRKN